ncbi:MAG: hypothetical protein F4Y12_02230 [Acidimicrobiaceae bacterium]|nr:hypothetical protein [Acidimicrobiaceae bacterium]MYH78253.1 hypothetical protein [Acidimicrobiaceae bacterium]
MPDDSEDLVQAIVAWSRGRPQWEQQALGKLARGESIGDDEIRAFADVAEHEAGGSPMGVDSLEPADFAGGADGQEPVRLVAIADPKSVNALTWSDGLAFAPNGITLVYGENGSGKSGYARILKKVTRSRHSTDVLTNVFEAPSEQSARLMVSLGSDEAELTWPSDHPDFLSRVSFYDRDCATRYISTETEVAYRPGAIALLDDLVGLAGMVRSQLEARQPDRSNDSMDLPVLPPGSPAAEFVASLSADTTALQIDLASEVPADVDERLAALRGRIVNLESDNPDKKRMALAQVLGALTELADHIARTRETLSDTRTADIREAMSAAVAAREAADAAGAAQFAAEPIRGVGSTSWTILWDAARRFSEEEAYPGHSFPVLENEGEPGRCVLCHQQLADHAAARLSAFDDYVAAHSERTAGRTRDAFERLAAVPRSYEVLGTEVRLLLQRVEGVSESAHAELNSVLQSLEDRRLRLVEAVDSGLIEIEPLPPRIDFVATRSLTDELSRQLVDLDVGDSQTQLADLRREEAEIRGRQSLRSSRPAIENRISDLKRAHLISEAIRLTDTRGITRRAADLTRSHVSDVLKHRFSQEALLLDLRRVRLADAGGGLGNLKHQARLVDAVQRAPLHAVLSEGEQTALGLAGFLTEVESDSTCSAVVFDDPVTSLDHVRRERVARRIVELASRRQVVIFTHDVAFVVDLKRAAEAVSVEVVERWVTKFQAHVGRVSDGGPWDSRMVGQRIDDLNRRLADVRRVCSEGDPEACQEAVRSWYQDLRLVWERALEEVVLGPVQVRGRLELRASNLKVLVRFNETDDQEFQTAFTRCGDRGSHDRSSELNRPLPSMPELEEDLESLRRWHQRVRRYMS